LRCVPTILMFVALVSAAPALAGTKDGGGGGAYVCRRADGSVQKTMLVDLWEGEHVPFLWPPGVSTLHIPHDANGTVAPTVLFHGALEKVRAFAPALADRIQAERDRMQANRNLLPEDVSISVPDDLRNIYFPTGCPAEGMMYYNNDTGRLDVRDDLYQKLASAQDVAAAEMHEAVYKIFRDDAGHADSKFARRLVACLFSSDASCLAPAARIPSDRFVFDCKNERHEIFAFPDAELADPRELLSGKHELHLAAAKLENQLLPYLAEYSVGLERTNGQCPEDGVCWGPWIGQPGNEYLAKSPLSSFHYGPAFTVSPKLNLTTGAIERMTLDGYMTQIREPFNYQNWDRPTDSNLKCTRIR
jgi:hypothetical protein